MVAAEQRKRASLHQTSVVDKPLSMLIISVLLLASTPRVQSQSMTAQCLVFSHPDAAKRFTPSTVVDVTKARFPSKRNRLRCVRCVWVETGLNASACFGKLPLAGCSQ